MVKIDTLSATESYTMLGSAIIAWHKSLYGSGYVKKAAKMKAAGKSESEIKKHLGRSPSKEKKLRTKKCN